MALELNMRFPKYYAHSLEGKPESQWQSIEEHLENTAQKAERFAKAFNAENWAYPTGLWHDIGKYSTEFQNRIGVDADNESLPVRGAWIESK